jgi:hypothetical protein
MAGWRDSASQLSQDDLDDLADRAMTMSRLSLEKRGGFHPFALTVSSDGQAGVVMLGEADPSGNATSEAARLLSGLIRDRTTLRAVSIIIDTRLRDEGTDAVDVFLEHEQGISFRIQAPYTKRLFRKQIEFGSLRLSAAGPDVWR